MRIYINSNIVHAPLKPRDPCGHSVWEVFKRAQDVASPSYIDSLFFAVSDIYDDDPNLRLNICWVGAILLLLLQDRNLVPHRERSARSVANQRVAADHLVNACDFLEENIMDRGQNLPNKRAELKNK